IKFTDNAPEKHLFGKKGSIEVKDAATAKRRLEEVRSAFSRTSGDGQKKGASEHLQEGKTAKDILEQGLLPAQISPHSGRVRNGYANDAEKDAVIQKMADEYADKLLSSAERRGKPLDGDLANVAANKDSALYRTLDTVARNYSPK